MNVPRHIGMLAVLAMVAAACGGGGTGTTAAPEPGGTTEAPEAPVATTAAPEAGPTGTLTVALSTLPNSIYTPNSAERNATNVAIQLFEGLTFLNDAGELEPSLATSWEVSEDGTEYTFTLREGVLFHDGTTLDAADVVASWVAGSDPVNAYADDYTQALTVEAVDSMTVRIITDGVQALFLVDAAQWAIVPSEYFEEVGVAGLEEFPIGTGPFKFVNWARGDRIEFEAFTDYWDPQYPKVEKLVFRPIPESSTRLAAVQTGEVDIAARFSAEEAATLEGVADVNVVTYPVDRVYYISFNNLTSGIGTPIEDVRVRQALNMAVDRQAIITSLFNGQAALATGLVSSGSLGHDPSIQPYPYDPDQARSLLADAGYPDGFEIGFACPTGAYTNFEDVCSAVAGYLEAVGVTFSGGQIQFMESGQYWDLEAAKELPPLFGDSWSASAPESLARLQGALLAEQSFAAWSTAEITALLEEITSTVDVAERSQLYGELHQAMYDDPPFIYLYEPFAFEGVNVRVVGYQPRAAENYFLKGVSVG